MCVCVCVCVCVFFIHLSVWGCWKQLGVRKQTPVVPIVVSLERRRNHTQVPTISLLCNLRKVQNIKDKLFAHILF